MVILGQRWAERYMAKNPAAVIQVTGGGSGTGISALINGTTDICNASRPQGKASGRSCRRSTVARDRNQMRPSTGSRCISTPGTR